MSNVRSPRLARARKPEIIRDEIMTLVEEYYDLQHSDRTFTAASKAAPVSGRVYDATDMKSLVDAALDFWLTTGRFNEAFEKRLEDHIAGTIERALQWSPGKKRKDG